MSHEDNQNECQCNRSKWVFHLSEQDHQNIRNLICGSIQHIEFSEMGFQALKANLEMIGRILEMDV